MESTQAPVKHELIDNVLKKEDNGIVARCRCGWVSAGHFSSLAASAAMLEHKEDNGCD